MQDTGISDQTIANYRAGVTQPKGNNLKILANYLGIEFAFTKQSSNKLKDFSQFEKDRKAPNIKPDFIEKLIGNKSVHGHGIPLIPLEAIAGLPSIMTDSITQTDCDHYCVPEFTDKGVEYLIRVSGSSMYPKYANGDILGCVRVKDILFFQWGKVYVLDTSQGALVKRVFECKEDPTLITLVSDNKEHYPSFNIPKSDIRSLSIVAGVIRME